MFYQSEEDLLSLADRLVNKVGFISKIVDKLADALLTKTIAEATCPPAGQQICHTSCGTPVTEVWEGNTQYCKYTQYIQYKVYDCITYYGTCSNGQPFACEVRHDGPPYGC